MDFADFGDFAGLTGSEEFVPSGAGNSERRAEDFRRCPTPKCWTR